MSAPTLTQAQAWRPGALAELAQAWDAAARRVDEVADAVVALTEASREHWAGRAADAAAEQARRVAAAGADRARALIAASVASHDGAGQIAPVRGDAT